MLSVTQRTFYSSESVRLEECTFSSSVVLTVNHVLADNTELRISLAALLGFNCQHVAKGLKIISFECGNCYQSIYRHGPGACGLKSLVSEWSTNGWWRADCLNISRTRNKNLLFFLEMRDSLSCCQSPRKAAFSENYCSLHAERGNSAHLELEWRP